MKPGLRPGAPSSAAKKESFECGLRLPVVRAVKSIPPHCFVWVGCFVFPAGSGRAAGRYGADLSVKVVPAVSTLTPSCGPVPAGRPDRPTYFLPPISMLYRVKLQYGFVIDATSKDAAYAMALKRLREAPETAISGVGPEGEVKEKRSLFNQFVTGK